MIEYANSRPQYSGRGGYGGQGYDSGAVSNAYNNLNVSTYTAD